MSNAARLKQLLARRLRIAGSAPRLEDVLRGTLRERYVRCGKVSCHCRDGPGHGPVSYLSVTLGRGRTVQFTIAPEDLETARQLVGNYERLWRSLEGVSAVNRELLQKRLLPREGAAPAPRQRRRRR
jgi:hypothetical protein